MGSMNFGLFPMLAALHGRSSTSGSRTYLEATRDFIFRNTFEDIEHILKQLGEGCGTRFEFECYDVGHLYNLAHFLDRGLVKPPLFVQTIFGILGGIGADPENLLHMTRIADKLFGDDYEWSVLAAGRHQMASGDDGRHLGGNVRVGLGGQHLPRQGRLAKSNAEQVAEDPPHPRRAVARDRHPDEARAAAGAEGLRRGRLLSLWGSGGGTRTSTARNFGIVLTASRCSCPCCRPR